MKQSELEDKVRELFERQGFKVEKDSNTLRAENGQNLELKVFSSEKFSIEDIIKQTEDGQKVFVDEELEKVKERIRNDISILAEEKQDPDYNTPSYEVIGDIAVINDLADVQRQEAVKGILHYNPNLKTILLKKEGLKGEFRIGDYEKLYGEETETIHKEHGCRYKVDVTKAFFSEREATERGRVLDSIENGEKILVMFCGIGPYPVLIAKNKDVELTGIEKNPKAVSYAKENVELNKVEESVTIIEGDVSKVVSDLDGFDRILMPSPTNASEFLDETMKASADGTKVTLYGISEKENLFGEFKELIFEKARKNNFEVKISDERIVSDYSPHQSKVAIDFCLREI
jgi:tRNA (guanine37-N1)-methyltransferase